MKKRYMLVALAALSLGACNNAKVAEKAKTDLQKLRAVTEFNVDNMDLHVHAHEDFYNHTNGGWMKKTEIPSDEGRWGSFNELRDSNDQMTLALIDKALAKTNVDPNTDEGKVINFFNSAMNVEKRNQDGIEPIKSILAKIDNIKSTADVVTLMAENESHLSGLFGIGVYGDRLKSDINALYLGTGSIGLPERSYYVDSDKDTEEKRQKYVAHVARMLKFINYTDADATKVAKAILEFETQLATAMLKKEERRVPSNTYNPKTLAELKALAPNIDWAGYLATAGAKNFEKIIVSQPKYIKAVNGLVAKNDIQTIKDYLKWNVINDAAGYLTTDINDANFDFYGTTLRDLKEQKPLKERVLQTTNGVLGEAVGQVYVEEYFPTEAKESAVAMVENIRKAYENRINKLDWMSEETKKHAIKKLHGMTVKIGYPDKWKDYSALSISDNYYENIINTRKWQYAQDIVKIGEKVDKTEWFMSPQTVNAYYNPSYNEIVFPAAILQPPFFDYKADAALNYGGMGAVIGHEISHGFDDQGAKYDAEGNMKNWWTPEDESNFKERGDKLVAQYDKFEALPGVFVNGRFTLGENIGDLGGVNAAYDGLQLYLAANGRPEKIDDMTQEQRFFVNWATIWRSKYRDEALKNQIKTDPHSPGQFRATGPLVNVDAFYEAFDIKKDDKMYVPVEERVKIW